MECRVIIFIAGFVIELQKMDDVHKISMETVTSAKFGIIFQWIYIYICIKMYLCIHRRYTS